MNIKIIKYYIILLVVFFSWVSFVNASVVINRVNLDPVEERFIELRNNSDSSQDLTGWSIKRKSSSGSEYPLVASSRLKDKIITANDYFILTNEETYTGTLYPDATWAKSYTFAKNNIIILYDNNGEIIDDWIISDTSNNENTSDDIEINNGNDNIEKDTTTPVIEDPVVLKITTKIISPKIVTAGIPFTLNSQTTTNRGETYMVGRFIWNFGDGMIKEVGKSEPFNYVYDYPGEYVLTLSYFDNVFSQVADATNRITIKVIPSEIFISSVGSGGDSFIELENKSNYEIILSNWVVTAGIHYFKIPEGTTLLPNKKIKLSPKITGFTGEDIRYITIKNPSSDIVATYPVVKIQKVASKSTSTYAIAQNNVSSAKQNLQEDSLLNNSQVINLNDLSADAGGANIDINKSTYAWIGLFVIIGLGVASFWIIKKRNTVEDYIDRQIRAEDMTIVE